MLRVAKTVAAVSAFVAIGVMLSGCEDGSVSVSSDTAKSLACSTARASNQAGKISDDMRKQVAQSVANSVSDPTVKDLAQKVHDSDTPEQLRAAYDQLITTVCGPGPEGLSGT